MDLPSAISDSLVKMKSASDANHLMQASRHTPMKTNPYYVVEFDGTTATAIHKVADSRREAVKTANSFDQAHGKSMLMSGCFPEFRVLSRTEAKKHFASF